MIVAVIGGGAAGFFTAINMAERHPDWNVTILEKSNKLLSKVKVSGGGRCNVTNGRSAAGDLVPFYPRGNKKLYKVFQQFSTNDMVEWLQQRGVETHMEDDLRMFPVTNDSQTIINCFLNESKRLGITIRTNFGIEIIRQLGEQWEIRSSDEQLIVDKLVIATGSSPAAWKMVSTIGLDIVDPVPSLFTFNIKDDRIANLMGISFPNVSIKIAGTKLEESGPLLITHWGLSGPAVLKLSAWGARELNKLKYQFRTMINFTGTSSAEQIRHDINQYKAHNPKRKVSNYALYDLPKRFWSQLVHYCEIGEETPFGELSKKQINKLTEELYQGLYQVKGKSTFKEEFVTSGGVNLNEINLQSFEAKRFPNLYLAGEVLDIDALTGGFNFQACWSGGWIIAQNI
ncbi:NAD(P)/FAD-dependent oxidoreductase [Marinoscillum sp.]|uniref:NAD(P)/FAD-dependent oxidoreductase n=1 Tax=Marinoscillum sp. TaxID=2024838 RepID=UPI003BA93F2B